MSSSSKLVNPQEIWAADARASSFMKEGIRLLESENDAEAALRCFDCARELRSRLPTDVPLHAYGLAACWLNRAEALTRLGYAHHALALSAYDEALTLLRPLPLDDDVRFAKRLAIAEQNRALVLAAQDPPATAGAVRALLDAIATLDHAVALDAREREHLLAVAWMNLANVHVSATPPASDHAARKAAARALELTAAREHEDVAVAEAGLKARHVLCQVAARRLDEQADADAAMADDVHEATDFADDGLALVRFWERRSVDRFRSVAADLFRFGARVYARYQPHFLHEFINEQLDPRQSSHPYVESREIQDVAKDLVRLLQPSRPPS